MSALGLFFVGSVLFVNGLVLLGKVNPRGAAPINAFVGTLLAAVTALVASPLSDLGIAENREDAVGAAGFLLFAFTYLWVALNNWTQEAGNGLGWYCLWSAGIALFLAAVNFIEFEDPRFGTLWVLWSILFAFFFVVLALGREDLAAFTGYVTIIEAFVTSTIPGALLLLDRWEDVGALAAIVVGAATVTIFLVMFLRTGSMCARSG